MSDEDQAQDAERFISDRVSWQSEHGVRSTYPGDRRRWARDYLADELVTTVEDAGALEEALPSHGVDWQRHVPEPADEQDVTVGYTVAPSEGFEGEFDPLRLVRQLNEGRIAGGLPPLVVSVHYVPSIARTKIGPGSDPWPPPRDNRRRPLAEPVSGAPLIGIVDTGVWEGIPSPIADAGGASERDPVDDSAPWQVIDYPGAGHGGFIAGIIGQQAPGVEIVSRRAYLPDKPFMTERSVRRAGDEAVRAGARILNLSLGTYADDTIILTRAVERWVGQGCLVVAAAGNEGTDERWYPAGFATDSGLDGGVVSVGACRGSEIAPFSNHNPRTTGMSAGSWVVCWAPGWKVLSLYPEGMCYPYTPNSLSQPFDEGLAFWHGTSFAAPVVAADVARYAAENRFGDDVQGAWAALQKRGYGQSCDVATEDSE
jgi:hypothetical protein